MTNKNALAGAVFDVDGTLINSASIVVEAVTKMFLKNNITPPPASKIVAGIGLSLEDALLRIIPEEEKQNVSKLAEDYRVIAYDLRTNFEAPLYEGALEFLDFLEKDKVLLAIATGNSQKGVNVALKPFNIMKRFIAVKTADICLGKPNPDMLNQIMKETGIDKSKLVMIGDSIYDIQMAKNAGTKSIGVAWGYHSTEDLLEAGADVIADSFYDIKDKFTKLIQD